MARAEEIVRTVAAESGDELPALTSVLLDRLRATLPEFFVDDDVAADMAAAVAANVRRVQQLLAHGGERAMGEVLPVEAGDLLQSTIQHGIPLISLLEAYRSAQGLAAEWWQQRLDRAAPPAVRPAAGGVLTREIVGYIDAAAAQIRESYELERRAHESSPDGRRAHVIRRLLAGEPLDADAAARTLNHPLDGRHVALVLVRTGEADLAGALATVAEAMSPIRTLTLPARHRVYAWLSTHGGLDPEPLRAVRLPPGVHVAASGVQRGVDGFVRAHRDAVRTAGIAREGRGRRRVAFFEELELAALLSRDPGDCDRFVRRVLGPLALDTPSAERARQTLGAYLAAGSSPSRAAERLGVHRNTVAYRLNGLRDVLADLDDRRLEVELALHLVEQLGPAISRSG